jgi:predicted dehydrogenase
VISFPKTSTERAELEDFAAHILARTPMALPGGDAVHNVALLGAIMASIESSGPVRL